jgi:2-polyprenyl-3-methyl-5-hydroxy-6-metoxy-1,4-benzoquinol methylase
LCGSRGQFYAQARDIEYFTSDATFTFNLCSGCDVLFIDPMLQDRLGEIYPDNYYSFGAQKKNLVVAVKQWLDARSLKAVLRAIPGDDLKVLDIGGGSGWLASLVRELDPRISVTQVVDLDETARSLAEQSGHRYFCGRIEDFDTEERYDLILMLNLIEHVANPRGVLAKAKQLLTPNGRLYIKTPNFRALDAKLFRHANWGGYHCPRHFVLFTRESLSRLLKSLGLRVSSLSYTQGAPFWALSIFELLRRAGVVEASRANPPLRHPLMPFLQAGSAALDFMRSPFARLSQMIVIAER